MSTGIYTLYPSSSLLNTLTADVNACDALAGSPSSRLRRLNGFTVMEIMDSVTPLHNLRSLQGDGSSPPTTTTGVDIGLSVLIPPAASPSPGAAPAAPIDSQSASAASVFATLSTLVNGTAGSISPLLLHWLSDFFDAAGAAMGVSPADVLGSVTMSQPVYEAGGPAPTPPSLTPTTLGSLSTGQVVGAVVGAAVGVALLAFVAVGVGKRRRQAMDKAAGKTGKKMGEGEGDAAPPAAAAADAATAVAVPTRSS